MITFFLHISDGVRSVATECTIYALGNGSFDKFHWLCNILLRNGREVAREKCVLSMERWGRKYDGGRVDMSRNNGTPPNAVYENVRALTSTLRR
jgi:hypothetical protein